MLPHSKGAIVLANIRAIGHDESLFKNPQNFMPERFLEANEKTLVIPNAKE